MGGVGETFIRRRMCIFTPCCTDWHAFVMQSLIQVHVLHSSVAYSGWWFRGRGWGVGVHREMADITPFERGGMSDIHIRVATIFVVALVIQNIP